MNWLKSSILAVAATASLGANAGLLTITDGAVSNVPGNNFFFPTPDGLGVNAGLSYNIGGQLSLTKDAHLTYTYLGKEAGYWNKFSAGGHSIVTQDADKNATNPDGSVGITLNNVLAGVLDFSFATNGDWDAIANSPTRSGTVSNSDAVRTAWTSESAPRLISFAVNQRAKVTRFRGETASNFDHPRVCHTAPFSGGHLECFAWKPSPRSADCGWLRVRASVPLPVT